MPLGYGSTIELPQLSSLEVALAPIENRADALTTLLRILLTIGEIAIGFTGIGAVAETGVALAVGAANEALDIQEGNASVTGGLLNFVTPLIGGGFSGLKNFTGAEKLASNVLNYSATEFKVGEITANRALYRAIADSTDFSIINKGTRGLISSANKELPNVIKGLSGQSLKDAQEYLSPFYKRFVTGEIGLRVGDNAVQGIGEDKRFVNFLQKSGMSSAQQLELRTLLRGVDTVEQQRTLLLGFIRNLSERDSVRLFRAVSGEIEQIALNEAWQLPFARQAMEQFDALAASRLDAEFLERETPSLWKRIVRKVGSPQFNEKIVQRAQLIDPNDLGRAGIEKTYQLVKKQIRKYFKRFKKVVDGMENIEDAFVKGGGIMVDSDWHLGYKVIKDLGINKQLVQITYGKDTGNFKHVMVFASDSDLKAYIRNPGKYYINNWAYSRGGKALGLESLFSFAGIKSLGNQAASILGFIPVQALKNVLSLVSNYVENIADIANGSYFNSYIGKFSKSLRNAAISRSFRFLGKEVLGGAATVGLTNKLGAEIGRSIGDFIGKEAQRVGTQILATGVKNVIAGEDFSKGLANKAVSGALVSIRSNSLRHLRTNRPNSVIVNTLTARRKLQQVKRIPNAVVPGRPFKGIKL